MSPPIAGALAPAVGAPERVEVAARSEPGRIEREVAMHAHVWLAAGCVVGLLLASLLLSPRMGDLLVPLTYGRWAALHLDLTLYGWLGVPLLGLLFRAYRLELRPELASLALAVWSGALAAGAVSWLAGESSGKLFLDWTGAAAHLFTAAQLLVAGLLVIGAWHAYCAEVEGGERRATRRRFALRLAGVAGLVAVPLALEIAERPELYPRIDPASGGPTAAGLLISTLALVGLLLAAPRLAGLPVVRQSGRGIAPVAFVLHAAVWALAPAGDRANDPGQLALLASLAVWIGLLPYELRRFRWPASAHRWLASAAAWGLLLTITGVAQFSPPVLAGWKFTHLLVAHAHLATAGFSSALVGALLRLGSPLPFGDERAIFWLWNLGLAAHVVALAAVGLIEAADPAAMLRGGIAITALYDARWIAGAVMTVAAARWIVALARESR